MAFFNKEKTLKTAQKYVSQGKLENAIKEYEKLLKHEPNDPTLLNTVGDLNLSIKRTQTAINYFKKVAQKYIDGGFYGRALAVYRKIVRAEPTNLETNETLADLFVKEGVLSDARKIYADIGRQYLGANQFDKAYLVFKKLADLSQDDPKIHLKLAELSIKLELIENARESYQNAAAISFRQKDLEQAQNAILMALEIDPVNLVALRLLFKIALERREHELLAGFLEDALAKSPDSSELQEMLGQCYMFQGQLDKALGLFQAIFRDDQSKYILLMDLAETASGREEPDLAIQAFAEVCDILLSRKENSRVLEFMKSLLENYPDHLPTLEKLADVYYKLSDNFNYAETLDKMATILLDQKDDTRAIQVLEKLLGIDPGNEKYQALHKEAFTRLHPDQPYRPVIESATPDNGEAIPPIFELNAEELSGEGLIGLKPDTDMTLEVDLLLNYGLKDKAKVKLQEKIKEDPNDVVFRQKLKELYKEEGNLVKAADVCFEIVNILTLRGEHDKAESFLEEARSLDPSRDDMAVPTGLLSGEISFPEEMDTSTTGFDLLEIEDEAIDLTDDLSDILVGDVGGDEHGSTRPPSAATKPPADSAQSNLEIDTEMNLRLEELRKSVDETGNEDAQSGSPAPSPASDADISPLLELELLGSNTAADSTSPTPPPASQSPADLSLKELQANLHEIDFYIKLGFAENARQELLKLKKRFPDNPDVLGRLRTLDSGAAPGEAGTATGGESTEQSEEEALFNAPPDLNLGGGDEEDSLEIIEDIAPEDVNIDLFNFISMEPSEEELEGPQSTADARKNIPTIDSDSGDKAEAGTGSLFEDVEPDDVVENSMLFGESSTSSLSKSDLFAGTEGDAPAAKSPENMAAMHNIFADIVEEANKIFAADMDENGDFDTHYNLGIAYKEMGLIDDAIGEFQKAFQMTKDHPDSQSFIKACHILSLCFFEKGLFKSSIKWCERGINSPNHEEHEYKALKYDMAQAFEQLQDYRKALDVHTEIYEMDVNYRDVASKIKELRKKLGS